jgi:predicted nucleic acid-binding protein
VEGGEERLVTSPIVVFETIFTLQRTYRVSKTRIRDLVLPVITLPGLQLPNKPLYRRALELYVDRNLPFADAYNVAYMEERGLSVIYSWDADFDRVIGIARVEP